MFDQLIIGARASYDDFGASLAGRKIKPPKKKSIKETVPFSNETYDFSRIGGELFWEERDLEYTFEMTADTPEELEDKKRAFTAWVANVFEDEIHDPYIPGYHFIGTYEDMDPEDEETLDKTTITVSFKAYPYAIANQPKIYEQTIPPKTTITLVVVNEGVRRVVPTMMTESGVLEVQYGSTVYQLQGFDLTGGDGTARLVFEPGAHRLTLKNTSTQWPVLFSLDFTEEVF